MKKKVKWSIKGLLARGQQKLINGWLKYIEHLSNTKEEMIHVCEPKTGRNLNTEEEKRSDEDLIKFQVGRNGLSSFQVGNGKRPCGGLVYC
jgi:hypothetical protein